MRPQPQQLSMHPSHSAGPGQNPSAAVCVDVWEVATAGVLSVIARPEAVRQDSVILMREHLCHVRRRHSSLLASLSAAARRFILYNKAVLAAADSTALVPPFSLSVRVCCCICNSHVTDAVAAVQRRIARSPVRLRHRMRVVVHSRKLQRNGHVFMMYTSPRYALHLCA